MTPVYLIFLFIIYFECHIAAHIGTMATIFFKPIKFGSTEKMNNNKIAQCGFCIHTNTMKTKQKNIVDSVDFPIVNNRQTGGKKETRDKKKDADHSIACRSKSHVRLFCSVHFHSHNIYGAQA